MQQQIDTADDVLAAVAADAADDGLLGKVGLLGTNLPALLDEAKAALANGDHDMARAKAQQVIDTVDTAPAVGRQRSLWVGGGVLLALLLATLMILLLRRRRRRRHAASVKQHEGVVASSEDLLCIDTQPVETTSEQSLGSDCGTDIAVEEIPEIDLSEHATPNTPPDSKG